MTSINAIRLDHYSGLLVCDEARFWNPEWLIILTPDKIRRIVGPEQTKETGVILFLGSTGASSFGDEINDRVNHEIMRLYNEAKENGSGAEGTIFSIRELAKVAFGVAQKLYRQHLTDFLDGRFHLLPDEVIAEKAKRNGHDLEIHNQEMLDEAARFLTLEKSPAELAGLTNNAQLLAGYDPVDGFQIFTMEERDPVLEEVSDIALTGGSGKISLELTASSFAHTLPLNTRRQAVERVEALFCLLEGLDQAYRLVAGVMGYPKIIYVNARQSDRVQWVKEISDCRSQLAFEIVKITCAGLLDLSRAYDLLDRLIFNDEPFREIFDAIRKIDSHGHISYYLRGYKTVRPLFHGDLNGGTFK